MEDDFSSGSNMTVNDQTHQKQAADKVFEGKNGKSSNFNVKQDWVAFMSQPY